jgi:sulfur carrier protein
MLGMGGRRVAVAVNREVLLRSQLPGFELAEGDRVEILEAVGGG